MWENKAKQEIEQLYPPPPTKQKILPLATELKEKLERQPPQNYLFAAQSVLCLVILLFAFFCRSISTNLFDVLSKDFHQMMTQGITYENETQLVRFVGGSIQNIRTQTAAWLEALEPENNQGQGGKLATKKKVLPEGVSEQSYQLPEKLTLSQIGILTSGFGFRSNPVDGQDDFHAGIDIGADEGTPVGAALDGQVVKVSSSRLRGNYIVVRHRSGLQTLYQHLLCSYVRVGQLVATDETIAAVGATGYVTGPHLHFEVVLDGLRVNPLYALPDWRSA